MSSSNNEKSQLRSEQLALRWFAIALSVAAGLIGIALQVGCWSGMLSDEVPAHADIGTPLSLLFRGAAGLGALFVALLFGAWAAGIHVPPPPPLSKQEAPPPTLPELCHQLNNAEQEIEREHRSMLALRTRVQSELVPNLARWFKDAAAARAIAQHEVTTRLGRTGAAELKDKVDQLAAQSRALIAREFGDEAWNSPATLSRRAAFQRLEAELTALLQQAGYKPVTDYPIWTAVPTSVRKAFAEFDARSRRVEELNRIVTGLRRKISELQAAAIWHGN